jgi:hypothetical protein
LGVGKQKQLVLEDESENDPVGCSVEGVQIAEAVPAMAVTAGTDVWGGFEFVVLFAQLLVGQSRCYYQQFEAAFEQLRTTQDLISHSPPSAHFRV